jgi:hypothetical protein
VNDLLRAGPRLATSLPVALRFPDADPSEGWGRIIDISVSGVRLETRWRIEVGQAVYLTFVPHGEMRLENLRARVIRTEWEDGYYVAGLAFDATVDPTFLREALVLLMSRT